MNHTLHLADGDLVRYLDQELGGREFRQTMQHLARCMACEHRLERLREQSQLVSGILAAETVQPASDVRARALAVVEQAQWKSRRRARIPVHAGWRVAAVVALLVLGTVALHPPLRAWVAERFALLTGTQVETVRPVASETSPVAAEKPVGSTVSFQPAGETFELQFENAQQAGRLRVVVEDVPNASAQAFGSGRAEFLVLPGVLKVANSPTSDADYVVTLPAHVQDLQIRIGTVRATGVSLRNVQRPWTSTYPLY